jgi:AbiV family abortive infection protein
MKIPLNRVAEGADLCLENAQQFCSDARILGEKSSCEHALGLCILALEELGKAIMLKEKATMSTKRSEHVVSFESVRPEEVFNTKREYLKAMGFSDRKINPFYDHPSKLLYARNMIRLATWERVMKSVNGKMFLTSEEMDETIRQLWKQATEVNVERRDLRELVFYVDYDQEKDEWSKGRVKLTPTQVKELTAIIEGAISLNHQWKIPTSCPLR